MKLEKFKELRVVVQNCFNPRHNGKTYSVSFAELNSDGHPILFLKIPNMDSLLTITLKQVAYVKVLDFYVVQYRNTLNNTILNVPYYCDDDKHLEKIANFDVYRKETDILSLVV